MNTQPDLLQRQAAEFKGAINLLVSEECFLRDRKLLRRAVHHEACATHEPLKMPGIGYSCKPTFGPNRENSQFFLFQAKPTPKTKRLETKGLIGTARWTKPISPLESVTTEATIEANKSFRINKRWLRINFIRSQEVIGSQQNLGSYKIYTKPGSRLESIWAFTPNRVKLKW